MQIGMMEIDTRIHSLNINIFCLSSSDIYELMRLILPSYIEIVNKTMTSVHCMKYEFLIATVLFVADHKVLK